ncbi:MAG: YbaY family lipoprotein [Actinomycetota bacterium]
MQPRIIIAAVLASALLAGGCASDPDPADATSTIEVEGRHVLSGRVVIRDLDDRRELPTGARVLIRLDDVSLADAASVMVAEATSTSLTLPLTYELRWDTELDTSRAYSVSAEVVSAEGELLFVSDTVHPYEPGDEDITVELVAV